MHSQLKANTDIVNHFQGAAAATEDEDSITEQLPAVSAMPFAPKYVHHVKAPVIINVTATSRAPDVIAAKPQLNINAPKMHYSGESACQLSL